MFAWGFGRSGALGLPHATLAVPSPGDVESKPSVALVPRPLPALRKGVTMIAAGGSHTLALGSDGTLWGWGAGGSGGVLAGRTPTAGCSFCALRARPSAHRRRL